MLASVGAALLVIWEAITSMAMEDIDFERRRLLLLPLGYYRQLSYNYRIALWN